MLPSVLNARAPSSFLLSLKQVVEQTVGKYRELPKAPSLQSSLGSKACPPEEGGWAHCSSCLPEISLRPQPWLCGAGLDTAAPKEGCSRGSAGTGRADVLEANAAEAAREAEQRS